KMEIALFHMSFNLITTILFLPMTDLIVKLTKRLVPAKKAKKRNSLVALDDRLLRTPGVAVGAVLLATKDMGEVSFKALKTAFDAFIDKDKERKSEVAEYAAQSSEINVDITSYLVKISSQSIGYNSEKIVSAVHTSITDIERLAELADNVTRYTEHYIEQELEFSEQVLTELKEMFKKIEELFHASMSSLDLEKDYDVKIAEGLEDEIDGYKKRLLDGHMKRLNEGICRPESSGVFINLVNNLERAGDHLMFIASAFNDAKDSSGR
ncbi:MAG: Na/Pi cotransporter family protein, partial [Clostridia bacterium]|nr:Na/Pi cotransporter family protein [Clostridia bacterium]